jgi:hypothetical protein
MAAGIREVVEGAQSQGEDEQIAWAIDVSNWGSSPTAVAAIVKDMDDSYADVTSTVMPINSPSVATDTITLSPLKLLTRGNTYRVEVKFTISGNVVECYFDVIATR